MHNCPVADCPFKTPPALETYTHTHTHTHTHTLLGRDISKILEICWQGGDIGMGYWDIGGYGIFCLNLVGRLNGKGKFRKKEELYTLTSYLKSKSQLKVKLTFENFQLIICRSCMKITQNSWKLMLAIFDSKRWAHSDTHHNFQWPQVDYQSIHHFAYIS